MLDVLSVISAWLFGYLYYRYLSVGLSIWILLAGLTLFGVLTVLEMFLSKQSARRIIVILVETVALLMSFRIDSWQVLMVTGVVVWVVLVWGYLSGRSRTTTSIEVPFFGASGTTLGKFTTAMIIFMILAYTPQLSQNGLIVPQQGFRVLFDWAAGFVNNFYPNVSLTDSFGTFVQGVATMELQDNPAFQSLPPSQQSTALDQTETDLTNNFSKSANTTLTPSEPASDAFYDIFSGMLSSWRNSSSESFVVTWGVILFFVLRGIGIIFVWFAEFISLIFYEILISAGFMRITEEPQTKESIEYA